MLAFATLPVAAVAALPDLEQVQQWEGQPVLEVAWEGNSITKDFLLERAIVLEVGTPFSPEDAVRSFIRLEELGVFSSIEFEVTEDPDGAGLRLLYRLTEMPWILPYLAFRYTEQNGWSVGPAVSSVNLFGRALYLTGRFLVGGTTTFEALVRWPALSESQRFDARAAHLVRQDDLNGFEETSDELLPWLTWSPTDRTRIAGGVGFFFMKPDLEGFTISGNERDYLLNVGLRLAWDSRDSFRYPSRGWYHELEVLRYGGDADTWRTTLDLRRHQAITPVHLLKFGALTTVQSGELGVDVPLYNRFFLGGANSVRGYDIDELGPELNGQNQMLLVAEYEWEFLPARAIPVFRWSFGIGARLAVFGDAGIAWSDNDQFRSTRFKEGAGIGLRLLVPGTNVMRLDFGVGESGKVYFHFSSWPRLDRQRDRLR